MTFPNGPTDLHIDLFYDGQWNEVGNPDTRSEKASGGGVSITRGRSDEAGDTQPTSVTAAVTDDDGRFSPRNANSPLFGKIGLNTPWRVRVTDAGVTPAVPSIRASSGGAQALVGATFNVAKPTGTQPGDVLVAFHFADRSAANIGTPTGGEPWIELAFEAAVSISGSTSSEGAKAWWKVAGSAEPAQYTFSHSAGGNESFAVAIAAVRDADTTVTPNVSVIIGGQGTSPISVVGTPETSPPGSRSLELRFAAGVPVLSAFPSDWTVPSGFTEEVDVDEVVGFVTAALGSRAHDDSPASSTGFHQFTVTNGSGGVRNRAIGVTVNVAALEDPQVRAAVEVAAWPGLWDVSGSDVWMQLQGAGIMRRLSRQPALENTIGRSIIRQRRLADVVSIAKPVAYWPMDDGQDTREFVSVLDGDPLKLSGTAIKPSSVDGPPGGGRLPEFKRASGLSSGAAFGTVPSMMLTSGSEHWEFSIWFFGESNGSTIGTHTVLDVFATGTVVHWRIDADGTADTVDVEGFDEDGVTTGIAASVSKDVFDNGWHLIWVKVYQRTSTTVGVTLVVDNDFANQADDFGGTWLAGAPTSVSKSSSSLTNLESVSAGHLIAWQGRTSLGQSTDMYNAGFGYVGELPTIRFPRLCAEEGVRCRVIGDDFDTSKPMGPQSINNLVTLLQECATVDGGVMYEPRGDFGLALRTLADIYDHAVVLALTYDEETLEPVDDDQQVRNDVTVTRSGGGGGGGGEGSSARVVQDTGPLSVDTIGVYDTSENVNVESDLQLPNQAGWRLHLGTVDETRYPTIPLDLATLAGVGLLEQAAALDVHDIVTIDDLPARLTPDQIRQLALGFSETIQTFVWRIDVNAGPASPFTVGARAEDTGAPGPADAVRRDTAGSELDAEFVAGVDTSMDVLTTLGPLWGVTGDSNMDFPFDVNVLGARIRVTGIGVAVGNVQTFTVDAEVVNGVNKTIPAGTDVRLWQPAVRAL